ncbi:hypothetical protein SDC9_115462 [bioreactor metagenome]|uniref:Uncharacterized protein n=1 Tax=bioreactor metagenome TaxID=1076179 RepID=A0A645BSY3_9ZZZZ
MRNNACADRIRHARHPGGNTLRLTASDQGNEHGFICIGLVGISFACQIGGVVQQALARYWRTLKARRILWQHDLVGGELFAVDGIGKELNQPNEPIQPDGRHTAQITRIEVLLADRYIEQKQQFADALGVVRKETGWANDDTAAILQIEISEKLEQRGRENAGLPLQREHLAFICKKRIDAKRQIGGDGGNRSVLIDAHKSADRFCAILTHIRIIR